MPAAKHKQPYAAPAAWTLLPALAAILLLVGVVYWPVLSARAFWFDDPMYVLENPRIQAPSWEAARLFLTEVQKPATVRGYYQPLTMLSLLADGARSTDPRDLRTFRTTNYVLHLLNTALVLLLLWLLFGDALLAAAVALLFGLHPITVEAVAWVSARKDLLSTCFALASLCAYVRFTRRRRWSWYAAAAVLFVLAMLAKPPVVVLPLLMILLDWWPLRRLSSRTILEKLPLLALSLISGIVTVISQRTAAGLDSPVRHGVVGELLRLAYTHALYLKNLVWPSGLQLQYPVPEPLSFSLAPVAVSAIVTLLIVALLLLSWRRTRAALASWLFFIIAILPSLGILGFTYVTAQDKYAYLPAVGLCLGACAGLVWLRARLENRLPREAAPVILGAAALMLATGAAWATRQQLRPWSDPDRLHQTALTQTPGAHSVRYNYATLLRDRGRAAEAAEHYRIVIEQDPANWRARDELGNLLLDAGDPAAAVALLQRAAELAPQNFEPHYNFGNALERLGRSDEAIEAYQRALTIEPDRYAGHANLGNVYFRQGRFEDALGSYETGIQLRPDYPPAHYNRGLALTRLNQPAEAADAFRQALQLRPEYAAARQQLDALIRFYPEFDEP